jgi:hypothetical protein
MRSLAKSSLAPTFCADRFLSNRSSWCIRRNPLVALERSAVARVDHLPEKNLSNTTIL